MKTIKCLLCALILASSHAYAADDLSAEDKKVLEMVAATPDIDFVIEMELAYPHLAQQIRDTAAANSGKVITRKKPNLVRVNTLSTKARKWEEYACQDFELRSETQTEWSSKCSEWVNEGSDNPAITNQVQNEVNGIVNALNQGKITQREANQLIAAHAATGAEFVIPRGASGS